MVPALRGLCSITADTHTHTHTHKSTPSACKVAVIVQASFFPFLVSSAPCLLSEKEKRTLGSALKHSRWCACTALGNMWCWYRLLYALQTYSTSTSDNDFMKAHRALTIIKPDVCVLAQNALAESVEEQCC